MPRPRALLLLFVALAAIALWLLRPRLAEERAAARHPPDAHAREEAGRELAGGAPEPVNGNTVRGSLRLLRSGSGDAAVTITASGRVLLEQSVAAGPFRLGYEGWVRGETRISFAAPSYRRAEFALPLPDSDLGAVVLLAALQYGGTVLDSTGNPLPGAIVQIAYGAGESAPTGEDGRYVIDVGDDFDLGWGGWGSSAPTVRVRDGERYSQPVQMREEGWLLRHDLTANFESSPRLRFLDSATRAPLPGLRLVPLSSPALMLAGLGRREVVTDGSGELTPHWPPEIRVMRWRVRAPERREMLLTLGRSFLQYPVHDVWVGAPGTATVSVQALRADSRLPAVGTELALQGTWKGVSGPFDEPPFELRGIVPDDGILHWDLLVPADPPGQLEVEYWTAATAVDRQLVTERHVLDTPLVARAGERFPPLLVEGACAAPWNNVWIAITEEGSGPRAPSEFPSVAELHRDGEPFRARDVYFRQETRTLPDGGTAWLANIDSAAVGVVEYDELVLFLRVRGRRPQRFAFPRQDVLDAGSGRKVLRCNLSAPATTAAAEVLVEAADGRPQPGALVTIIEKRAWATRGSLYHARSDADGVARIADLDASLEYSLGFYDPVTHAAAIVAGWRPGPRTSVRLEAARAVDFRVALDDGAAAFQPSVLCVPVIDDLAPKFATSGDAEGAVHIPEIVPSLYRVTVKARRHRESREPWVTHEASALLAGVATSGNIELSRVR